MNWQHHVILSKLSEGQTVREASLAVGVHRQTFWRWLKASPDFAQAVVAARETGKAERTFRLWLRLTLFGASARLVAKGMGEASIQLRAEVRTLISFRPALGLYFPARFQQPLS